MKTFVRGLIGKEDLNIGSGTFTRTTSSGGSQTMTSVNQNPACIVFADQMAGTDASAKIQAAVNFIAGLSKGGGIVDARNLSDSGGTGSTTIDPGTQSITILLGPYTYFIPQIKLQSNLRIYGSGMGNQASSVNTTVIQTTNSSLDAIILGTNQAVQGVVLDGFRLYAVHGNSTQKGLSITGAANGGLWYSSMRNVLIGAATSSIDHFRGGNMYFNAPNANANSINQFLDFTNVQSLRNSSTGHCLDIIGFAGQFIFNQCEFDGLSVGDGGTNINIADDSTSLPFSIQFNLPTIQKASVGVQVRGSWNVTFNGCHIENTWGVFNLAAGANNNIGFKIENSIFQTSGVNSGSGYYVSDSSTNGEPINFCHNFMSQAADTWPSTLFGIGNMQGIVPYPAPNKLADTTPSMQAFTSSGTFNVPKGVSAVKVRLVGGGGGGGGSTTTNNGGGGSAGGYTEAVLTGLVPVVSGTCTESQAITVTIGTGGTGGNGANTGAAGGSSSIAASGALGFSTITVLGGAGGFSVAAASPGGAATNLGTNGTFREGGAPGGFGASGIGGNGGSSVFGGGGQTAGAGGNPGQNATSHGAGGGGASSGSTQTGGSGVGGIVIFEWMN